MADEQENKPVDEKTDEELMAGREKKPAEINQPSADHVRSGERAMAKLDEYEAQIKDAKSSSTKMTKREQDDLQRLQEKQQLAKDADRKQQEIAHLRWKHADGSLTQAEAMELELHPEHTNIGSGHGNPA